jgi:hypothetical protein
VGLPPRLRMLLQTNLLLTQNAQGIAGTPEKKL